MPKIHKYQDISEIDREAKRDLIDRHSPFIHCADTAVSRSTLLRLQLRWGMSIAIRMILTTISESITLFTLEITKTCSKLHMFQEL